MEIVKSYKNAKELGVKLDPLTFQEFLRLSESENTQALLSPQTVLRLMSTIEYLTRLLHEQKEI